MEDNKCMCSNKCGCLQEEIQECKSCCNCNDECECDCEEEGNCTCRECNCK